MITVKSRIDYISEPKDVFNKFHKITKKLHKEFVWVLLLNTKNKIIFEEIVSIGILNASLIHPREVFRTAIIHNANSIILVHNHPSGDPEPSESDKEITKQLRIAGEIIGINLIDHIIIGEDKYYSFNEEL